jgi:hypothetical protein
VNLQKRDDLKDLGGNGKKMVKLILKYENMRAWNGFF